MSAAVHNGHAGVENPYAGQGAVLLDIGGDIGALVVTMPDGLVGTEVEIEPEDGHDHGHSHDHSHGNDDGHSHAHTHHREHVAVVSRPVLEGSVASLVFPALRQGHYRLYDKGSDVVRLEVDVAGGEVTLAEWGDLAS